VFGQRRVVFINKEDLHTIRMKDGEWIDMITLSEDGTTRRADGFRLVAYDIPRGCLAAYYPETNPLVPLTSFADQARTPTSKSIPVMLVPSQVERPAQTQTQTATAAQA
jgi:anaerobic selenocysteine-containing dehydrogenase